ncbi:MAG: hypothetical protein ISS57_07875 [Anaerolineales bacterium]|nr:hypothetical protein [Anaerolineales bacterium]
MSNKMTTWMMMTIFRIVIAIVLGWNMLQRVRHEVVMVRKAIHSALR